MEQPQSRALDLPNMESPDKSIGLLAFVTICLMLVYYKTHTFWKKFYTYHNLGWWGYFVNCWYLIFSNILYCSNICWWKFDIIIIFNTITALTLQMSRIRSTNLYLILKLSVFTSIRKSYDDRHLPQNRYSVLPPGWSYFPNGYLSPFDFFHMIFSHSWD